METNIIVPAASVVFMETATASSTDKVAVEGSFNKKYHDAARFWKPRPYFEKHYGFNRGTLTTLRMVMLIPSGIDLILTADTNNLVWVITFYTFWGFVGSTLAILASNKAVEF